MLQRASNNISRRLALAWLGLAPAAIAKPWEGAAFPNWSPSYIDRILTDSPWARSSSVSFELQDTRRFQPTTFNQIGLPGGIGWPAGGSSRRGIPPTFPTGGQSPSVRTEIFLTIRWAGALPVRQAMALQQFGAAGLESERAVELLNRVESEYVLEVAGFPTTIIRQGAERFEAELLKTAMLVLPSRTPLSATSVTVPPHGMHLMATLRFPRIEDISPKDLSIDFGLESGPLKVKERFKLKDMIYAGRLEL